MVINTKAKPVTVIMITAIMKFSRMKPQNIHNTRSVQCYLVPIICTYYILMTTVMYNYQIINIFRIMASASFDYQVRYNEELFTFL